ncbi:MAG: alpha-amylase, partial [Eubacterium sp.]|nr:alpha-amylase [Eubacterium sp.]
PVHILLYTLPGIPSVYYGSEFGIEGKKERYSDDSLRPALSLTDYAHALTDNPCTALIAALGKIRQETPALSYGDYQEIRLTTAYYVFARKWQGSCIYIAVNNGDQDVEITLPSQGHASFTGVLSGKVLDGQDGEISFVILANSGDIWIPDNLAEQAEPVISPVIQTGFPGTKSEEYSKKMDFNPDKSVKPEDSGQKNGSDHSEEVKETGREPAQLEVDWSKPYEEMDIVELQTAILAKLGKNGPVTDQMKRDVRDNVYKDSLINWVKSFR